MSFRIEILEGNFVNIYKDDVDGPVYVTPVWPNGERFETEEDARGWAEMFIESVEDPNAPFAPVSKGAERLPKITPEIVAELKKRLEDEKQMIIIDKDTALEFPEE